MSEQQAQPVAVQKGIPSDVHLLVHVAALSDVGRTRENNEDRLLVFDLKRRRELSAVKPEEVPLYPNGLLLVVADGMGGMSAGETASQMCLENFLHAFLDHIEPPADSEFVNYKDDPRRALTDSVRETNARVFARAGAERGLKGMGTTLTAAFLEGNLLLVAQVGDSRAYLLRDGEFRQLTRDQTLLASLMEKGQIQMGALGKNPFKNMLLQAVGAQQDVNVELTEENLQPGDWLLVCSDGLHGPVEDADLGRIMKGSGSPAEKARALVAQANANGGPDNISVIICEVAAQAGH
ncbi:MAG TPA: protein phosphatase 2C domain-containing protein [Candidatus Nitrosotenuis sp.]|nr:protein phosphatase 2C domain-containing protein [Candidatus Nitrosotenuis sp.]